MRFQGSWLSRGYFDFSADGGRHTLSQAVRDELGAALGQPAGGLHIASYPVGPAWRHTFWWREGAPDYQEAQFFAQIGHYPVLSLGLSVEKGRETSETNPAKVMDRAVWDWQGLVDRCSTIFGTDVMETARELKCPVNVRTQLLCANPAPDGPSERSFSLVEDRWYERRHGQADVAGITDYIREVDQLRDTWAIIHFAVDLTSQVVDGMDAGTIAHTLLAFGRIRRRVRGAV